MNHLPKANIVWYDMVGRFAKIVHDLIETKPQSFEVSGRSILLRYSKHAVRP